VKKSTDTRKSRVNYIERPPPKELRSYVEKIWDFYSPEITPHYDYVLNADYTSSILVYLNPDNAPQIFVTGPNISSQPLGVAGFTRIIGIRFHPPMLPVLLRSKPADMLNKFSTLTKFIGNLKYKVLQKEISKAKVGLQVISVMKEFLLAEGRCIKATDDDFIRVLKRIQTEEGNVKMEQIYGEQKLSIRQFQRIFVARTGLNAKEFCRLVRLRCSINRLVKENFDHFDVIFKSGYYDQSHYYREFKEILGMLPSCFEKRQRTIIHKKLIDK